MEQEIFFLILVDLGNSQTDDLCNLGSIIYDLYLYNLDYTYWINGLEWDKRKGH